MPDVHDEPSRRRVIGRILSLGFPIPGTQVDNYNFLSAPSFFDYDAIVVDPAALSKLIESVLDGSAEAVAFSGAPVRNEPEQPGGASMANVLLRRRAETEALLANGGTIICVAHPETVHRGISGVDELGDYYWLPPADEAAYRDVIVRAEGSQARVVDWQHPLATYAASQLANILYRAQFDVSRMPGVEVYARSQGGAAIGVEMTARADGGRVIFLPALKTSPQGDARYVMSDALQAGIRRALGVEAAGRPPPWLSVHPLPGLAARTGAVDDARRAAEQASGALDAAEKARDELARYQRLLWQEGAVGLDDVVIEALRLIGCDVYANNRQALELRVDGKAILFEVEGSEHPIDMAPHHRLRQRIEQAIERRGEAPRGVLFVNGQRLFAPKERKQEVSDSLRTASLAMRYCVAPTTGLYEAVAAKLAGNDNAVAAYRRAIASHDGVLAGGGSPESGK